MDNFVSYTQLKSNLALRRKRKRRATICWIIVVSLQLLVLILLYRELRRSFLQDHSRITAEVSQEIPRKSKGCKDVDEACASWAGKGDCLDNPAWMLRNCPDSCFGCLKPRAKKVQRTVLLHNGVEMPSLGFGTAGLGEATKQSVITALGLGYKLIDSAQAREWYREDLVGAALLESDIPRDRIFITSKIHPRDLGCKSTLAAFNHSLSDLHTTYLDLMLLHYPRCWEEICGKGFVAEGLWQDSWRALEYLLHHNKVRAVGVSNFDIVDLEILMKVATMKPHVIQRYADPLHQDVIHRQYCAAHGIQYQAYSSMGTQWMMRGVGVNPVLHDVTLQGIAAYHNCSVGSVVLAWALQTGQCVIPRSSQSHHMAENMAAQHIQLTYQQMEQIDNLEQSWPS